MEQKGKQMKFQVSVGNIGTIDCKDEGEARRVFADYKAQSESERGRAGGETVILLENGEPTLEHIGSLDTSSD